MDISGERLAETLLDHVFPLFLALGLSPLVSCPLSLSMWVVG